MATVQALRKDAAPPPRSPERQKLADAISLRASAERRLAKLATALQRADAARTECWRTVKQTRQALEDATANERHHLVGVALGEADAGASLDEARTALAKAENNYEAAKKVSDALQAEQEATEQSVKWAAEKVKDAVTSALRTSPEVERLQNDVAVAKRALAEATSKLLTMPHGVSGTVAWDVDKYLSKSPDQAWAAAIAALTQDADAPLPQS